MIRPQFIEPPSFTESPLEDACDGCADNHCNNCNGDCCDHCAYTDNEPDPDNANEDAWLARIDGDQ